MKNVIPVLAGMLLLISCNSSSNKQLEEQYAKQKTIDSLNSLISQRKQADSLKALSKRHVERYSNGNEQVNENSGSSSAGSTTSGASKKKKGWSNTAKGAAIGAGTGAVAGAIIDHKNRGAGAVIGGLVGAGVGAGTGAVIDKKSKQ